MSTASKLMKAALIMLFSVGWITSASAAGHRGHERVQTIDYGVAHVSTVPANAGEQVQLFVREITRPRGRHGYRNYGRRDQSRGAVLFVHGASVPGVAAFDFEFEGYSWGKYLAKAGYDVYIMELTGYGFSPRPVMDDPCNVPTDSQAEILIPNPLDETCAPKYPYTLSSIESEHDEIDTVVDFIRERSGVDQINLVGYSLGGLRAGTYAASNLAKVAKLIFYAACCYDASGSGVPSEAVPAPGFPTQLQTYEGLVDQRWLANATCSAHVEAGAEQAAWNQIMRLDPLGSTWGSPAWNPVAAPQGGVMRYPRWQFWGWNLDAAQLITVPTLLIVGEQDGLYSTNQQIYGDLGAWNKVFVGVDCATHFAVWERQHRVYLQASLAWLDNSAINGVRQGMINVDASGRYRRQ